MASLMQEMAACFGRKRSDHYHVISAFAKYKYSIFTGFFSACIFDEGLA
jgi:hypothetical protein